MDLNRPLNSKPVFERGTCVLYWMQSSQRPEDNPALNEAVRKANDAGVPVVVFFGLDAAYPSANARHYAFMLDGLRETETALEEAGIPFVFRLACPPDGVVELAKELRAREVVVDNAVLKTTRAWREDVAARLDVAFIEVASETVFPVQRYGKLAGNAAVLRPYVHRSMPEVEWDQSRPKVKEKRQRLRADRILLADTATDALLAMCHAGASVKPVRRFTAGTAAGRKALGRFVETRLARYDDDRNKANLSGTSELSPYLHYGQLGPHTIARAVREADAPDVQKAAFLEELLVRRELSWNLCWYEPRYAVYDGLPEWGRATLDAHRNDPRPVVYTREQLEAGETHDEVWNGAHREMVVSGRMHNYMRMLWAKKILEWSETPEEAFATAIYLNDKSELDGRDPNSYAGIGWAIGGRHDRPWPQRPIFGGIRYMSSDSARHKMNIPAYLKFVQFLSEQEEHGAG